MLFDYRRIIRLNGTEKKIYNYVVNHMDAVLEMNVRELAEETFVSSATIVRFTRNMGCSGFNDFKNQLREYQSGRRLPDREKSYEILEKEFHRIASPSSEKKIRKLAAKISASDLTVFLGMGKSGFIAGYAARYMMEAGCNAMAVTEPFYPLVRNRTDRITVTAISSSGETIEVVDQIRAYRQLGAYICAITGSADSTIARMSDLSLHYSVPSEVLPSMSSLTTSIPAMFIIENAAWYLAAEGRVKKVGPVSFR